jgi:hypothetical protein
MTVNTDAALLLARARVLRDAEVQRVQRARAARPPTPNDWRPTPQPAENNLKAANPAAVTMLKLWDKSPIDPWSFDPTEPPSVLPDAPVCTVPPVIQELDGHQVGDTLAGTQGTWTNAPTLAYQWLRDADDIASAVTRVYVLADADVGAMVGYRVTATNAGGVTSADADEVGPVVPAWPLAQ